MGRELRRVPLDFDWSLHMTWKGFLCPYHSQKCEVCDGSGHNPETKRIADDFYAFEGCGARWCDKITQDEVEALQAENRLRKWVVVDGVGEWVHWDGLTAEMVNDSNRHPGMGDLNHDAINRWILIKTRARRLGVFGECTVCNGEGHVWFSDEIKKLADKWKPVAPPTGPGFQLWETTSEGSPVSPVFETIEALCEWCADNATTFGSCRASVEEWLQMLGADFVCARNERGDVFM
jgi:hypothetical protein